ncbi:hypothetical protein [Chitinimonas sp. BJB300]|uniref:hypothetical protein n=1 Tax=Chitinimonas sp. BJB300 TaxID=1559339 RepID=UPI000C0DD9EF|nr:hypothetical protein [Chitinimonas sp. BJB300]PHV09768.1 hypothetical protein CSQ89_19875 [Chitinimonas sp. BJB300]TSJ83749.1 hypothetical protein FG002_021015 [Chitinimonas sp. BJB300]
MRHLFNSMQEINLRYLKLIRLSLISIVLVIGSAAVASPKFVYRAVARIPEQRPEKIFQEGFKSKGENDNVAAHTAGYSLVGSGADSAFISTASSLAYLDDLREDGVLPSRIYIYTIRADQNFYSINKSLKRIPDYETVMNQYDLSFDIDPEHQEYLALRQIPTQNIVSAQAATWDAEQESYVVDQSRSFSNPYYVEAETFANAEGYHRVIFDQSTFVVSANATGACSVSGPSSLGKRKKRRTGSACFIHLGFCPEAIEGELVADGANGCFQTKKISINKYGPYKANCNVLSYYINCYLYEQKTDNYVGRFAGNFYPFTFFGRNWGSNIYFSEAVSALVGKGDKYGIKFSVGGFVDSVVVDTGYGKITAGDAGLCAIGGGGGLDGAFLP